MSKELSMAARREITKKYAREYSKANRAEKSAMLDALVSATGWTRDHARRAIRNAAARKGAASQQQRTPNPGNTPTTRSSYSKKCGASQASHQGNIWPRSWTTPSSGW
jgi:hypothetical protein